MGLPRTGLPPYERFASFTGPLDGPLPSEAAEADAVALLRTVETAGFGRGAAAAAAEGGRHGALPGADREGEEGAGGEGEGSSTPKSLPTSTDR